MNQQVQQQPNTLASPLFWITAFCITSTSLIQGWRFATHVHPPPPPTDTGAINIVGCNSFPYFDGVTINTALRAGVLAEDGWAVVLHLPYCEDRADRVAMGWGAMVDHTPDQIAAYTRQWLERQGVASTGLQIKFYPAKFSPLVRHPQFTESFDDFAARLSARPADLTFIEEAEIIFLRHPHRRLPNHAALGKIVDFVHTDYARLARTDTVPLNRVLARTGLYSLLIRLTIARHSHRVVSLMQVDLPHVAIEPFPHKAFMGTAHSYHTARRAPTELRGAYHTGSFNYDHKGWDGLIQGGVLLRARGGEAIDCWAMSGYDKERIEAEIEETGANLNLVGGSTDGASDFSKYKVMVFTGRHGGDTRNGSVAQALVLGQFVLLPRGSVTHKVYGEFPNVFAFDSPAEFVDVLSRLLESVPAPPSPRTVELFSYGAAVRNILEAVA